MGDRWIDFGGTAHRATSRGLLFLLALVALGGCKPPMGRFAGSFANGLGRCPDPGLAREGIPACILMIESGLSASPDDPQLLEAAAGLYSFYGAHLVKDEEVARRVTHHALEYARRAADAAIPGIGRARRMGFDELEAVVGQAGESEVPALFSLGSVWMDWIRVRRDDLDAIADLPLVETIMQRVVELEPTHRAGGARLYLALLAASLPDEDEVIQGHFRRALAAADGKNLMPSVFYALWLRDQDDVPRCRGLLQGIVDGGVPNAPAYRLVNQLALEKAQQALAGLEAHE